MSDTIQALNEVVFKAGQRETKDDETIPEGQDRRMELLEEIAVIAGDCLEDHVKASDRAKPRKQRVYKEIVRKIADLLGNDSVATVEQIQALLVQYGEE